MISRITAGVAVILLVCLSAASAQQASSSLPETPRKVVEEVLHGVTVPDPYRWLEELESTDVQTWARAQDRATRDLLEALPGRAELVDRVQALAAPERTYPPQRSGDMYYYVRLTLEGDRRWDGLFARSGRDGAEKLLIDTREYGPEARFARTSGTGVPSLRVSDDGRHLAFGISQGSSRWSVWRILDLHSGELLPEQIEGVHATMATVRWRAGEPAFVYGAYDIPDDVDESQQLALTNHRLFEHRLGTETSSDRLVLERPDRPEMSFWAWISSDGSWLLVSGTDADGRDVSVVDLRKPSLEFVSIAEDTDASFSLVDVFDDRLWLLTTEGAPRGRIVAADLASPAAETWHEILAEDEEATLGAAQHFGGRILTRSTRDAIPEMRLLDLQGQVQAEVEMPYIGWLRSGIYGSADAPTATFSLQGTGEPDTVYELDLSTGRTSALFPPSPKFDHAAYVSEQVFYPGADGVRVPMTLMYRRGLERDGSNPTWLYAYGSNWSAVPWYDARFRVWLELGGVYALANIRGGGEYGAEWRLAGSGVNKQVGVDDYIAAAEWLIESGYSSTSKLVANGGSASGPVAAAAVLQRPGLFAAAAIDYPVLDLIRYHLFSAGSRAGNWGVATDADEFNALLAWSPYHNTQPGTCYPPTIIAQGDQDRAASPLHSYKFTAALQHAQGCDSEVLLQVGWGYGHTVGGVEEVANQIAFLASITGLPPR